MEYLLLLVIVLVLLFVTSQRIFTSLFYLLLKIFHSKKIVTSMLSITFFPGVVIHELAHAVVASLLHVRVGDIEFTPVLHDGGLKMGSVQIGHTDPFRRFLIGVAPVLVGGAVLVLLIHNYLRLTPSILGLTAGGFDISSYFIILTSLFVYSIFVITNTMFSSKKDMEGALGLLILVIFLISILFVAGRGEWIISGLEFILFRDDVQKLTKHVSLLLLIPLVLNVSIVLLFKALVRQR